ncbi:hypothetical protein WICPIJ_000101 [Wickerhamomyces pijperi]|uniref:Uncharacterized protein n=1 Tax=Wickerhamomyces pijperi TaxID=599730 RepID=A0A9P8QDG5_WICPI|nr:hypothetical protein WICPIJ_000101 [Wickerhamomyces pijperi]
MAVQTKSACSNVLQAMRIRCLTELKIFWSLDRTCWFYLVIEQLRKLQFQPLEEEVALTQQHRYLLMGQKTLATLTDWTPVLENWEPDISDPWLYKETLEEALEMLGLNLLKTVSFGVSLTSSPEINLFKLLSNWPQTLSNFGLPNQPCAPSDPAKRSFNEDKVSLMAWEVGADLEEAMTKSRYF